MRRRDDGEKAQGFAQFEFQLGEALQLQAVDFLKNGVAPIPLTFEAVTDAFSQQGSSDVQGVYVLYLGDGIVYVGKSESDAGLRKRLLRHVENIQHRPKLDTLKVSFAALRILVFSPRDIEERLIKAFAPDGEKKPPWNNSGFGNNALGRRRHGTAPAPGGFDHDFPISIDLDMRIENETTGAPTFAKGDNVPAIDLLRAYKRRLPYLLQYECLPKMKGRGADPNRPHPGLGVDVSIPDSSMSARKALELVVAKLPPNWQATRFPGFVGLFAEVVDYSDAEGETIALSPGSEAAKKRRVLLEIPTDERGDALDDLD